MLFAFYRLNLFKNKMTIHANAPKGTYSNLRQIHLKISPKTFLWTIIAP